jgi:hypothetical protein
MEQQKLTNSRKYFSYVEVIENPSLPFSNDEVDSVDYLKWDKDIFNLTFDDFSHLMKLIKSKREVEDIKIN